LQDQGYRELDAVLRAVKHFTPQLIRKHLFLSDDNENVVSWLRTWKPPLPGKRHQEEQREANAPPPPAELLREVYDAIDALAGELTVGWVPSKENIADCLSRISGEDTQIYLPPTMREQICEEFWSTDPEWRQQVLELFAFPTKTWAENFCSRFPWPASLGDAFAMQRWNGPIWAFPPPKLAVLAVGLVRRLLPTMGSHSAILVLPEGWATYTPTLRAVAYGMHPFTLRSSRRQSEDTRWVAYHLRYNFLNHWKWPQD
jgi:hypothetical protein